MCSKQRPEMHRVFFLFYEILFKSIYQERAFIFHLLLENNAKNG